MKSGTDLTEDELLGIKDFKSKLDNVISKAEAKPSTEITESDGAAEIDEKLENEVIDLLHELTGDYPTSKGKIGEMAAPTDPVAGLLNSQISYYFHLAFFIACLIAAKTSPLSCYVRKAGLWEFYENSDYLNENLATLTWVHIVCFLCLLLSKSFHVIYGGTNVDIYAAVLGFITIPIYF